jgi:hypothetical protein
MNFENVNSDALGTEITSGSNSARLCLATTVRSDCVLIREIPRNPHILATANHSSYTLKCSLLASGGATIDFIGHTVIGRKFSSDGWVPQSATVRLRSCRTDGIACFKAFYRFVRKCVVDENFSEHDVFPLFGECVKHSSIAVDLNVLASHAQGMPTWLDEYVGTVLAFLSRLCEGYDLRRALSGMANRFADAKWQLD